MDKLFFALFIVALLWVAAIVVVVAAKEVRTVNMKEHKKAKYSDIVRDE